MVPREGHPAKEGLRRALIDTINPSNLNPREGHPAKEGLRPVVLFVGFTSLTQRGSSSKRGIKTMIKASCEGPHLRHPREGHPAKEGLRLLRSSIKSHLSLFPREGHPAKEGLRRLGTRRRRLSQRIPERVIQQNRD